MSESARSRDFRTPVLHLGLLLVLLFTAALVAAPAASAAPPSRPDPALIAQGYVPETSGGATLYTLPSAGEAYAQPTGSPGEVSTQGAVIGGIPLFYNFSFNISWTTFKVQTTNGVICSDNIARTLNGFFGTGARLYSVTMFRSTALGTGIQVGPLVNFPINGIQNGYCWTGLNTSTEYFFRFGDVRYSYGVQGNGKFHQ